MRSMIRAAIAVFDCNGRNSSASAVTSVTSFVSTSKSGIGARDIVRHNQIDAFLPLLPSRTRQNV